MPAIELRGNSDLRKALRRFAPDLDKELKIELRKALSPVVKKARGFVENESPMRGWAPRSFSETTFGFYQADIIRKGIGFSTGVTKANAQGFTAMAKIYNNSKAGAIYEVAGIKNPQGQPWVGPKGSAGHKSSHSVNPKAGEQFINNLPPVVSSLKGRGRLIFRAWAESKGAAEGGAMKAIDKATMLFMARAKTTRFRSAA